MAVLPSVLRKLITDWAIETILDCHLGEGGREPDPHITIKYGFTDDDAIDQLRGLLVRNGPFRISLGRFGVFKSGYGKWKNDDGDVLYVEVESPDLVELNRAASALPNDDKHPDYQPHITVAYLSSSELADYYTSLSAPFLEAQAVVEEVEWSPGDGSHEMIPLSFLGRAVKGTTPWLVKGEGTCEQGQTAAQTGCTPANGEASQGVQDEEPKDPESRAALILKAVVPERVRAFVVKVKDAALQKLYDRYGERTAKAIIAAAALSVAIPLPGTQPAAIAVSLIVAEALRAIRKMRGKSFKWQ
ncbi:MAG: 2'-5' RNA ligase family protein, partial [Dehalococcoidia bacterium]|nr:2'-5' RNA ligase family protein [Dehalococcoidia bacterium]